MPVIGIEEHWTTPQLTSALKALPDGMRDESLAFNEIGDHLSRLEDLDDGRISAMDEQGIDLQILGMAPPATGPLPASDAIALSRDCNDAVTDAVRQTSYSGLGDATDLALSTYAWGWHLEAALAALRLIAAGTFDRHPRLQVVLGHWGELLPFWGDRTDSLTRAAGLERPVSDYLRSNVHLTCSGMLNPTLLRHALEVTTIDHLLFSTDYPFQHPGREDITRFLAELSEPEDRAKFSSANACRLFGLDNPVGNGSQPRS